MSTRYYGIEIELEQATTDYAPPAVWVREGDGSLRNHGMEFKSYEPLELAEAKDSLGSLDRYFERRGMTPEANSRCSIHIHMDVRDMSNEQVYALLCNYTMIESMFFAYVGGDRKSSHFCVPYYHCKRVVSSILNSIKEHNPQDTRAAGRKYMALNVLPMHTWGSVEWRHFPAVLPVTKAAGWLDILDAIKTSSLEGVWTEGQAQEFVETWLPGTYDEELLDRGMETYYYHTLPQDDTRQHHTFRPVPLHELEPEPPEDDDEDELMFDEPLTVEEVARRRRMEEVIERISARAARPPTDSELEDIFGG